MFLKNYKIEVKKSTIKNDIEKVTLHSTFFYKNPKQKHNQTRESLHLHQQKLS